MGGGITTSQKELTGFLLLSISKMEATELSRVQAKGCLHQLEVSPFRWVAQWAEPLGELEEHGLVVDEKVL